MIKTFADTHTYELYATGVSRRFPAHIHARSLRKLDYINLAVRLEDLRVPPGNRLHRLYHDRENQYAIWINGQWRICFRFDDGDAYDVEICDYH